MTTKVQILIFAALACVLVQHAAAQSASDQVDNPRIITSREYLISQGIGVSRESLARALHNDNPRVRLSAAGMLGQDHPDEQSIAWIKDAFTSERDPQTKVYLAAMVLVELDMTESTKFLIQTCSDNAQTAAVVREATRFLVQSGEGHQCVGTVLKLNDTRTNVVDTGYLVQLIGPLYPSATARQKVEILSALKRDLEHSNFEVRASASRSVWLAGATESPEILRAALLKETNPIVKNELETDLANLSRGVK